MYKCICFAVSEDDIKELVDSGYSEPLACKALRVGECCGICIKEDNEKTDNGDFQSE